MLDTLAGQGSECLFIINKFNEIEYVSSSVNMFWGVCLKDIIGKNFSNLFSVKCEDGQNFNDVMSDLYMMREWRGTFYISYALSDEYVFNVHAKSLTYGDGCNSFFVFILKNSFKENAIKSRFHMMQKLETIGLLACKVAHDFNNLLTVIGSCADCIRVAGDDSEKSMANEILKSVDSASVLTNSLLYYGKSASMKDEFFDMNRLVCNSETLFRQFLEEDIDLLIDIPNEEAFVYADYSKIQHALINLIVNARDAVNSSELSINKTIRIKVCLKNKSELIQDLSLETVGEYENYVVLIVEDNGQGINDSVRENLFEPFFTTKTSDAGSGLGLASVKDIVKQYDGKIFFESEKDKGAAFYLILPQVS